MDPEEAPHRLEGFVETSGPNLLTEATLTAPDGAMYSLSAVHEDEWRFAEGFAVYGEMTRSFPPGNYQLQAITINDGSLSTDLSLPTTGYPGLTTIINFDEVQAIDPDADFTVRWDPIPGGTIDDAVTFEIQGHFSSPEPGEAGQLTGLSTEFTIPAGTLEPGRAYTASIRPFRPVDIDESHPGILAVTALGKTVELPMRTTGGVDDVDPMFVFSNPANGESDVELNSVVVLWFNEAMAPAENLAEAIAWTGLPDPSLVSYLWSRDRQRLYCHYPPGLPASAAIEWILNPLGSSAKLRDLAGNPLPDGFGGAFQTAAVSNLGVPDVRSVWLAKGRGFHQGGAVPRDLSHYTASLDAKLTGVGSVMRAGLTIPGRGTAPNLGGFTVGYREIRADASFAERDDLDRIFPDGDYTVILRTVNDGIKEIPLTIDAAAYPDPPTVQDFDATQHVDIHQPFTLRWNPMPAGTTSDFIEVSVASEFQTYLQSPPPGESGALDGTATSITIPASTFPPGATLQARLLFAKVVDTELTAYPGVPVAAAVASSTEFQLRTAGLPFRPQIEVTHQGSHATITVTAQTGRFYELRASGNLLDWFAVWSGFLDSDGEGYTGSVDIVDDVSGIPERFYQLFAFPFPE